jgi:hypothetical protein
MEKRYFFKQEEVFGEIWSVTPLLNQNKKQISVIGIVNIFIKKKIEELIVKMKIILKSLFCTFERRKIFFGG